MPLYNMACLQSYQLDRCATGSRSTQRAASKREAGGARHHRVVLGPVSDYQTSAERSINVNRYQYMRAINVYRKNTRLMKHWRCRQRGLLRITRDLASFVSSPFVEMPRQER